MFVRSAVALLAVAAVAAGCGTRTERASGILVFDGLATGSYLHAIRPDGRGLEPLRLPKTCSPSDFSRDGRVLRCDEWTDPWGTYAVTRRGQAWRRVPLPREWRYPPRVAKGLDYEADFAIDAPEWAPAGDRIAFIRRPDAPYGDIWYSGTGNVVVADREGKSERVVARRGEVPTWSPDGTRLAFARCRVTKADPTDEDAEDSARCSIWTVSVTKPKSAERLADDVSSPPVWSPDGNFVAFLRATRHCAVVCKRRIFVVRASGRDPRPVGPTLTEASQLFWLPQSAPAVVLTRETTPEAALGLQRCVDIWNRARMQWPTGAANVRLVKDRCQVTVAEIRDHGFLSAGFPCWQPVPFSYQCPSHGGALHTLDPAQRVWNAEVDKTGKLTLARAPRGPRLPLPTRSPYPLLNGYVLPFGTDGRPRPGLIFARTLTGTCVGRGYVRHPDSLRCGWTKRGFTYVDDSCFKAPGRLRVGDVVLCPEGAGSTSFIRLKLSKLGPSD